MTLPPVTGAAVWTCPNCRTAGTTPYCPVCGERRLDLHELTLRGLVHQAVEAFTSVDARIWRTLGALLRRPGQLTVRYREGSRTPYIGSFALFLLANVLFVGMELLPGSNTFSTPLDQHIHNQAWSPIAQELVMDRLVGKGTTPDAYAPVFDQAVAKNAQSLVILMVVPFALLLPVLFRKSRMPFAVHLAYSLHFHAFLLLLISAALVVPAIDLWLGGAGLASQALDNSIAIVALLISAVFLYVSTGRVYGSHGSNRALKAALLTVATGGVFLAYRFILLLITLYTT